MKYSFALIALLFALLSACKTFDRSKTKSDNYADMGYQHFVLPQAVFPLPDIQSLELFPANSANPFPVIQLNGSRQLVLSFDHLSKQTKQFKITISHRNQDWTQSALLPTAYTSAFFKDYFGGGLSSFTNSPSYHHYEYRFPNERLSITKSGNYLLSVYNYHSNKLLFRIPFFVTENQGEIHTRVQTVFANDSNTGTNIQPLSRYKFPAFITLPQFNLSASYVLNKFWGRTRIVKNGFYAGRGLIRFRLRNSKAFAVNGAFNIIDLRSFPPAGKEIKDFIPEKEPPAVILKKDVPPFSALSSFYNPALTGSFGKRSSQYIFVHFRFEPPSEIAPSARMYLVGTFNNWSLDERFRMRFDHSDSLWKGTALIKQGVYFYKYIVSNNGSIEPAAKISGLSNMKRSILTFIYYRDPQLHYDRLLKADVVYF